MCVYIDRFTAFSFVFVSKTANTFKKKITVFSKSLSYIIRPKEALEFINKGPYLVAFFLIPPNSHYPTYILRVYLLALLSVKYPLLKWTVDSKALGKCLYNPNKSFHIII